MIVALDLGTRCGWAVRQSDGSYVSGVWDLRGSRHEGAGMRFVRFRSSVSKIVEAYRPNMVAYEEVRAHRGTSAAHVYGGLVAILQAYCEEHEIPYLGVPVATLKRVATGRGNAKKSAVMAHAVARWPSDTIETDDEADARWCAEAAHLEIV